ncbi:MAG: polyprenol monophosphomannose synthase [bacterium]|nr:polyprenol monophosphomannose synthase [bacterium]MDZ4232000.1 polyprenol monophosphomannose synthase [Candidatus Pacearchaeota archaeon]
MSVVIIIPTYNEKGNIARIAKEVLKLPFVSFLLIVDDSSPDGTGKVADELARSDERVRVLHRASKEGLGAAYVAGFFSALALPVGKIVTMDADFSHDPGDIPRLLAASNDADVVVGSRYVQGGSIVGWGLWRKVMSQLGTKAGRILLALKAKDCTAGFRCYSREFLESLDVRAISSQGYAFQLEMLFLAQRDGYSLKEIPITFREREAGRSKMGAKEVVEFAASVLSLALRRLVWKTPFLASSSRRIYNEKEK